MSLSTDVVLDTSVLVKGILPPLCVGNVMRFIIDSSPFI